MIRATEANLAVATDRTIIIPGHGHPVSNRAELSAYRDMLVAIHDNVARLKHAGRSLDRDDRRLNRPPRLIQMGSS